MTEIIKKQKLRVLGNGTYKKEVETTDISISGSATFFENIITEDFRIIGHCKVHGEVSATQFVNRGSCTVKKCLTTHGLTNLGKGYFHYIKSENIDSSGHLEVDDSVQCKRFTSKGALKVNDTLSGEILSIELSVPSRINKIEGEEKVSVKSTLLNPFTLARRKMTCHAISAGVVDIENTEADHVSGKIVKIGKDCRIDKVFYTEDLEIHPSSYVGTKIQK